MEDFLDSLNSQPPGNSGIDEFILSFETFLLWKLIPLPLEMPTFLEVQYRLKSYAYQAWVSQGGCTGMDIFWNCTLLGLMKRFCLVTAAGTAAKIYTKHSFLSMF